MESCAAELICRIEDLVPNSGVAALYQGEQIALFYLTNQSPARLHVISNFDPHGRANVLSRGIVGDVKGESVVASPLYKQHFSLTTGLCIEDPELRVSVYDAQLIDNCVYVRGFLVE